MFNISPYIALYRSVDAATRVKEEFHGRDVGGRTLSIEYSSAKEFVGGDERIRSKGLDDRNDSRNDNRNDHRDHRTRSGDNNSGREGGSGRDGVRGGYDNRLKINGDSSNTGYDDYPNGDRDRNTPRPSLRLPDRISNKDIDDSDTYRKNRSDDTGDDEDLYNRRYSYRDHGDGYSADSYSSIVDTAISIGTRGSKVDTPRSRSRDRDRFLSSNGRRDDRSDRSLNIPSSSGYRDSGSEKSKSQTSVALITLPFSARGGRFIYEHSDGRREYVDAAFASPIEPSPRTSSNPHDSDEKNSSR